MEHFTFIAITGTGVRSIKQAKAVHASAVQAVQDAVKTGAVTVRPAPQLPSCQRSSFTKRLKVIWKGACKLLVLNIE